MGTQPATPAVDPSAGPQHPTFGPAHPRYADGTPILLGDHVSVITEMTDHAVRYGYDRGVVTEVRFISHKGEVWISTDTGRNMVFRAYDLEHLTTPAPPRPRITQTPNGWRYQCAICPDARAGGLARHYDAELAYGTHTTKPGHRKHLAAWEQEQQIGG